MNPPPVPTKARSKLNPGLIIFFILAGLALLVPLSGILWRHHLSSRLDRELARIRAAKLPTSGAELNSYYTAVPDNENAALVLTQAFALLLDFPDSRSNDLRLFKIPGRHQSLSNQDVVLLKAYVDMNSNAVARARSALALAKCRYPVDYSPGIDSLYPHLGRLKMLAGVEEFRCLLAVNAGRVAEGTKSVLGAVNLARTLENEPTVIAQLTRISILSRAEARFEWRANAAPFVREELDAVAGAFAGAEDTNAIVRALIGERAIAMPNFRMSWSQIKQAARQPEADEHGIDLLPDSDQPPGFLKATGFFERDLLCYLIAMRTNIATTSLPPPKSLAAKPAMENAAENASKHFCVLSSIFLSGAGSISERAASSFARVRFVISAVAIERFYAANGGFPAKLEDLIPTYLPALPLDPFDGQPLRYKTKARGYILYSVDKDGRNDDGRERPQGWKPDDKTTYDIVFSVER